MDLFEYQARDLFESHQIPVLAGAVATTPDEAHAAATKIGGKVVVKAQVKVGGRGKAGGVKLAENADDAKIKAAAILGMDIKGHTVNKVMIAQAAPIDSEYYLAILLDRANRNFLVMASVHGLVGCAEKSAYVAAKHGIVGLTKVCALENATSGVTCNAICPGWVLTPLVQKQVDAKAAALGVSNDEAKRLPLVEKEPSLKFTTPEELGALAVFLCSPAADNVRGTAGNMDGGWAAQ